MSQPTPTAPTSPARQFLAESLRLTAFPSAPAELDPSGWWTQLVGSAPETSTSRPGRGELQEIGRVGTRNLLLSVLPGRIDWFFVPPQDAQGTDEPRRIGPLSDALSVFNALMSKWLQACPPMVRLAFGAVVNGARREQGCGLSQPLALSARRPTRPRRVSRFLLPDQSTSTIHRR